MIESSNFAMASNNFAHVCRKIAASDGTYLQLKGRIVLHYPISDLVVSSGIGFGYQASFCNEFIRQGVYYIDWCILTTDESLKSENIFLRCITQDDTRYMFSSSVSEFTNVKVKKRLLHICSERSSHEIMENKAIIVPKEVSCKSERRFVAYQDILTTFQKTDLSHVRICIVATDFVGPIKNGGIGTFNSNLARLLADHNAQVTVLWTHGNFVEAESITFWTQYFKSKKIEFVPLASTEYTYIASQSRLKSLRTRDWLRKNKFDFVYFSDMGGCGYDTMLTKRFSDDFEHTQLILVTHSSTKWHLEYNNELLDTDTRVELDFLEKSSTELADLVISPSRYLLDWCLKEGWNLPQRTMILPYPFIPNNQHRYTKFDTQYKEICFFGRLETRKGLELFCDAIDVLCSEIKDLDISFLGKEFHVEGVSSSAYIRKRSRNWNLRVHIINNYSQSQAVSYLTRGDVLAVLPSITDNSPFTVYECLNMGIPFIASKTGGIPELVKSKTDLFKIEAKSLVECLKNKLGKAPQATSAYYDNNSILSLWIHLHTDTGIYNSTKKFSEVTTKKKILLCLLTSDHADFSISSFPIPIDTKDVIYINKDSMEIFRADGIVITLDQLRSYVLNNTFDRVLIADSSISYDELDLQQLELAMSKSNLRVVVSDIEIMDDPQKEDTYSVCIPAAHAIPSRSLAMQYVGNFLVYGDPRECVEPLLDSLQNSNNKISRMLIQIAKQGSSWAVCPAQRGKINGKNSGSIKFFESEEEPLDYVISDSEINVEQSIRYLKNKLHSIERYDSSACSVEEVLAITKFFTSKKVLRHYTSANFHSSLVVGGGRRTQNPENYLEIHFDELYVSCIIDPTPGISSLSVAISIECWFSYGGEVYVGFSDTTRDIKKISVHGCQLGVNILYAVIEVDPFKPLQMQLYSKKGEVVQIRRIEVRECT